MSTIYSIDEIRNRLAPIFSKYNVQKAALFGSYAKGTATPASDIDVFVDSGLHGIAFFGLLEEAQHAFECTVDLIDAQDVIHGSRIYHEVVTSGIVIYKHSI